MSQCHIVYVLELDFICHNERNVNNHMHTHTLSLLHYSLTCPIQIEQRKIGTSTKKTRAETRIDVNGRNRHHTTLAQPLPHPHATRTLATTPAVRGGGGGRMTAMTEEEAAERRERETAKSHLGGKGYQGGVGANTHTHLHTHTHPPTHTPTHPPTHTHTHTDAHTYTHTHTHTYTHTHTHSHTHTHTHTQE